MLNAVHNTPLPFALQTNFLDPLTTSDGKPYGPIRYKQLVEERYFITKHSNITYSDTGKMNPTERGFIISWIKEEIARKRELLEKNK